MGPPAAGQTQWAESVLYSFTGGADGGTPVAGLVFDTHGALYGTTQKGGSSHNAGTVFKLTPPAAGQTQWTESVLYTFDVTHPPVRNEDGGLPSGRLTFDTQGALYGTTMLGGFLELGAVFKLTPPSSGTGPWTYTKVLGMVFRPTAGVIFDTQGALYGTAAYYPPMVFKVTAAGTTWLFDGAHLNSGGLIGDLTFDAQGALYTVTSGGAVLKLTRPASGTGPWTTTVLYNLSAQLGSIALIFDTQGSLYGTTANSGSSTNGTVFKLTPPASGKGLWTETVLHTFSGHDGADPQSGLIFGPGGILYGATYSGGKSNNGTAFQISNPSCSSAEPKPPIPLSYR